ncbi:MAG TPA: adenylate/guanylate cyclase domain-containing protein [Stellaceae bacterium]|jgi:adenylate cyclase
MRERRAERRLAAILMADVVGYSRLVGADEEGTLEQLQVVRRELVDPTMKEHRGRIVRITGDGLLVEFASVVDAVRCAVDIQREMAARNAEIAPEQRIEFRIGINLGDILRDGRDIYGDGVNVAARLEALAAPGGICVSRVVRDQVRDKLGFSFDDRGEQQVKNIARPVRVFDVKLTGEVMASAPDSTVRVAPPLPDKPSIAVLPFQNMSGDPEQEYFADGMVEEIITALSRIRWLFVIARNSSSTYKGQAVDLRRVGRELGVRYILEGSVRKGGDRVRITAQLIEAETTAHLWADRFDGRLEDVFELQDKVAARVAGIIEPTLQAAEVRRAAVRPTHDLTAYDCYLRALATYYPITREHLLEALELAERAVALDRDCGPALSLAAMCRMRLIREGWSDEPEAAGRDAVELARRALQAAEEDPGVLANAAFVLANFGEDIGTMMELIDRALVITPSFARGWFLSGVLRLWAGQPDRAIEQAEMALRLSPRDRTGTPLSLIGEARFFKREFDEAASRLLLCVQANPGYPHPYRVLAACYAHMGRLDDARATVRRLRAITTEIVPSAAQLRSPADRELFLSGLRLAAA